MKILLQRVKSAHVAVDSNIVGKIDKGLVAFLGIHKEDTLEDTSFFAKKLVNLRVFEDHVGKMNLSVKDVQGNILVVSQFTLYGSCQSGCRPGFSSAMSGELAYPIYQKFVQEVKELLGSVQTGQFGAMMQVHLINDGPVTLLIEKS